MLYICARQDDIAIRKPGMKRFLDHLAWWHTHSLKSFVKHIIKIKLVIRSLLQVCDWTFQNRLERHLDRHCDHMRRHKQHAFGICRLTISKDEEFFVHVLYNQVLSRSHTAHIPYSQRKFRNCCRQRFEQCRVHRLAIGL